MINGNQKFCYLFVGYSTTWTNASAYCALQTYGYSNANLSLTSTDVAARLLFFTDSSYSSEISNLTSLYSQLLGNKSVVWTLAINQGSFCESSTDKVRDYWADGLNFAFNDSSYSLWESKNTRCPVLEYSAAGGYQLKTLPNVTGGSPVTATDCYTAVASTVVCKGKLCLSLLTVIGAIFTEMLLLVALSSDD